jgi:hypothetical protein
VPGHLPGTERRGGGTSVLRRRTHGRRLRPAPATTRPGWHGWRRLAAEPGGRASHDSPGRVRRSDHRTLTLGSRGRALHTPPNERVPPSRRSGSPGPRPRDPIVRAPRQGPSPPRHSSSTTGPRRSSSACSCRSAPITYRLDSGPSSTQPSSTSGGTSPRTPTFPRLRQRSAARLITSAVSSIGAWARRCPATARSSGFELPSNGSRTAPRIYRPSPAMWDSSITPT